MKKLKIIVLLMFVFFTTGCSVVYNLEILEDLSINEEITASENTKQLQIKTSLPTEDAANYLYNMFNTSSLREFTSYEDNDKTIGESSLSYDNLNKFSKDFTTDVFPKVKVTEQNNKVTFFAEQKLKLGNNANRVLIYDDIIVNIKVPFKVLENNADEIDGDTYTWNIKKNELKNINLVFDKSRLKNTLSLKLKNNNLNINYSYIIIGGIIFAISIIVMIVIFNNKKNNRL